MNRRDRHRYERLIAKGDRGEELTTTEAEQLEPLEAEVWAKELEQRREDSDA